MINSGDDHQHRHVGDSSWTLDECKNRLNLYTCLSVCLSVGILVDCSFLLKNLSRACQKISHFTSKEQIFFLLMNTLKGASGDHQRHVGETWPLDNVRINPTSTPPGCLLQITVAVGILLLECRWCLLKILSTAWDVQERWALPHPPWARGPPGPHRCDFWRRPRHLLYLL